MLGKERFSKIKTEIYSQDLEIDETTDGYCNKIDNDMETLLDVGHCASLPQNSAFHTSHPQRLFFHLILMTTVGGAQGREGIFILSK